MATFEILNINGTLNGFEAALHGMRQPLQSFDKSDSYWEDGNYVIGPNDYKLAKALRKAGPEHCKYLRMIPVWIDITAPESWWTEFDTYKVGTTANSTSTMHTLHREDLREAFDFPFGLDQDADAAFLNYLDNIKSIQERLNKLEKGTDLYNQYHDMLSRMLPRAFKYTRTVSLSYAVLANMYAQRKNHRKAAWNTDFVSWVKSLPYSELITGEFED